MGGGVRAAGGGRKEMKWAYRLSDKMLCRCMKTMRGSEK